jgi:hypothetical protein
MLASKAAFVDTPAGLNMRFGYFCSRNFFVRPAQEMCQVNNNNFKLVVDEFGDECLR